MTAGSWPRSQGIAIYVYGIQPAGLSPSTDTSTNTNLTFSLDGQVTRQIANNAPPSTSAALSFTPNALLYHNAGLTDTTHSLTVTVGSDSIFLFDYLIFTSTSDSVNQLSPTFPYNLILAQTSEVPQYVLSPTHIICGIDSFPLCSFVVFYFILANP